MAQVLSCEFCQISKNTFFTEHLLNQATASKSTGTHWIALNVNGNNETYFDRFGLEHLPKETKTVTGNKNIITCIYRIQTYDSIMRGYFIRFIDFMLEGKRLLDYTNLFSANEYEKNHIIVLKYFH